MPVFHTKTIESILEPVAQQVSRLIILHEEAEDGNAMPDLAKPVQTVKIAVDNLVRVGHETISNSEDQLLKQDMPPALHRVEDASYLLLDASQLLRSDPYSAPARKKLIEGSRGILQGTSALLLAFDESEVRKIIRICKNVLEYLAITEVVETMDDLVTFVKNLSPVLTNMTKQVDSREKELTHQVHRDLLVRSLDRVKQLTPVLISGVKIYIGTKDQGGHGLHDAQSNRDYVVHEMSNEIHEIIRVLQLTTYDEDEWDADDITVMRRALNALEGKMKQAQDWLHDPHALVGGSGEKALRQILDDATKVADRCADTRDRDDILRMVEDITSMADTLAELRQAGQGDSAQALALARSIQDKLGELQEKVGGAVNHSERSGIKRPAHTLTGKVDQAQRWLNNPAVNDMGLGEQSVRMVVDEGRRIAESLQGPARADMLRNCDEVEMLSNQLGGMCRNGMANTPQARAVAAQLSNKLHQLKGRIQDTLINHVADDFIDISGPLKQMSDAALASLGSPNREATFEDKAGLFQDHSNMLGQTAQMVAADGGNSNRKTVEGIFASVNQVNDMTPQVVKSARIVLLNPDNQTAREHFDMLKKQWMEHMEKLRGLVDEAIDTSAFIRATETGILKDTDNTENAIQNTDPPGVVYNTSNIARRANRVLQVAQQEADNSEDPHFVDRVNTTIKQLRSTITPMVQNAKVVAQNPRDQAGTGRWRGTNQQLIDAVGQVRQAVTPVGRAPGYSPLPMDEYNMPPDMSQLHISGGPKDGMYSDTDQSYFSEPELALHRPDQSKAYPSHFSSGGSGPKGRLPPGGVPLPGMAPMEIDLDELMKRSELEKPKPKKTVTMVGEHAPPRPPLPMGQMGDGAPPRPPPLESEDEDEQNFPMPQANQPIMMAAHALHMDVRQWSSRDNDIIAAAKRMAVLMAKLSQLVRGEGGKRELIDTAKAIAEASEEVTRLAKELARECTDKRMRTTLLQVCERIPTIGTQLKILSTVKATMLGAQEPVPSADGSELMCGSEEDEEATEMLIGNAQNLMQSVRETVKAAMASSIKIRVDSGYNVRWVRKKPWYT